MDTVIIIDGKLIESSEPIRIRTLKELADLHRMLERRLSGAAVELIKEKYIRTEDALKIAEAEGVDLPATTLKGAIVRHNIEGVRKPRGRWEMPESEFRLWLDKYKERR